MEQTNYRILKLKNGESIIAGVLPMSHENTVSLENPMIFKTISMIDEKNFGMREFLVIRNWAEYSTDKVVQIPSDTIMAILIPDEKITSVYDFEKNKGSISDPQGMTDAIQDIQNKLKSDTPNDMHTVNLELQLSPEASMNFLDLLGIELTDEQEIDDIDEMDDLDEDDIEDILDEEEQQQLTSPKSKKTSKEDKKPTWGNSFEDWSPDPNDYLK